MESTSSGSAMSSSHGQEEAKECSASYQKLVTNAEDEKPKPKVHDKYSEQDSPTITGFRFFDMEVLSSVFEQLRCGDCGSFSLLLMEDSTKRKGCASTLRFLCEHWGWKFSFCTSRKQGKSYEVNRRLVYGMRTIGKGYAGARKFCAINEHANFRGSAPAMEPEGADRIFRRSVEKHNLRYTEFYGDGYSKSFTRVKGVYEDD